MDTQRARKLLGVGGEASEEEIRKRYRELAMEHHPDRNGDTGDEMAELNKARDLALAATGGRELASMEKMLSLIQHEQATGREQVAAREKANRATDGLVQIGIGRLAQLRHAMMGMGAVLAGLAVLFRLAPETSLWFQSQEWFIVFGGLALLAGFTYLAL